MRPLDWSINPFAAIVMIAVSATTAAARPRPLAPAALSLAGDWRFSDGQVAAFRSNGTFYLPNDGSGIWREIRPGQFELRWGDGAMDRMKLVNRGSRMEGDRLMNGQRRRISAVRTRTPGRPAVAPIPPPSFPGVTPPPPTPPDPVKRTPPPGWSRGDEYTCQSAADCVIFCPKAPGCCPSAPCGCRSAIRKDRVAGAQAAFARSCTRAPDCPAVGCAWEESHFAECRNGQCVAGEGF